VTGERGPRQLAVREHQRDDTERHIDREQPLPRCDRQNSGRDTRPDRGRDRSDERVDPDTPAELVNRIDKAEQGRVDAHDPRTAKTLEDARGDERGQRAGERASQRAEREHGQPPDEHAPVAAQLAERGKRQQRDRHRELIGVDHPDRIRRVRTKLSGDGRQRDVGDGTIQHRHRKAGQDNEYRPPPLRLRQAVSRRRSVHAAPALPLPSLSLRRRALSSRPAYAAVLTHRLSAILLRSSSFCITPAAAATLARSTKRMEYIKTRRSRNSWWRVRRRRTACRAPIPEETLKAYLVAHNPSRQSAQGATRSTTCPTRSHYAKGL
jgi:hypothetical protein